MTSANTRADGSQTIESLAGHITEAMIALIGTGQELAFSQSERTRFLNSELGERTSQLGNALFDSMAGVGRINLDIALTVNQMAVMAASVWWREIAGFNRALFDKGLDVGARMLETRSAEEMIALQTDYLKLSLDEAMAESAKLYELAAKVTDATMMPLGGRVANTVTSFARPKAA